MSQYYQIAHGLVKLRPTYDLFIRSDRYFEILWHPMDSKKPSYIRCSALRNAILRLRCEWNITSSRWMIIKLHLNSYLTTAEFKKNSLICRHTAWLFSRILKALSLESHYGIDGKLHLLQMTQYVSQF